MATIVVGAALAVVLYKLARAFARNMKNGGCASGCAGCSGCGGCACSGCGHEKSAKH